MADIKRQDPKDKTVWKVKRTRGRPQADVDWEIVKNLFKIQCSAHEAAAVLGINRHTLGRSCERDFGITISELKEQYSEAGKASLRRMQWRVAESDNPTMLIWLGKQYLKQADKHELEAPKDINVTITRAKSPDGTSAD